MPRREFNDLWLVLGCTRTGWTQAATRTKRGKKPVPQNQKAVSQYSEDSHGDGDDDEWEEKMAELSSLVKCFMKSTTASKSELERQIEQLPTSVKLIGHELLHSIWSSFGCTNDTAYILLGCSKLCSEIGMSITIRTECW